MEKAFTIFISIVVGFVIGTTQHSVYDRQMLEKADTIMSISDSIVFDRCGPLNDPDSAYLPYINKRLEYDSLKGNHKLKI